MDKRLVHGTCIALPGDRDRAGGPALAVLLRGPSGAGKSDLALRLIDRGWRLVADDQTELTARNGALLASAPASIAGRMEVRGLGILPVPSVGRARLCLVADLAPDESPERLPERETCSLQGVALRRLRLDPFEASAAAKLRLAVAAEAADIDGLTRPGARDGASLQRSDEQDSAAAEAAAGEGGQPAARRRVVLVTGLSGAGRSSALDILEDLGYEAIDNPPLELLEAIIDQPAGRAVALGVDIRTRNFAVEPFLEQLDRLKGDAALQVTLLFVDCDSEVLRRRYSETRRRHPLAQERPLRDGIRAERRLVAPLRERADLVVDTSSLRTSDFREVLNGHLGLEEAAGMALFVTSFSYRHGLPQAADLVFDVRFLANPHYEAHLRPLTGRDPEVAAYVAADPQYQPFFDQLTAMLHPLLPHYEREGKSYLTIAVGCTGGQHRSVTLAERLAAWLRSEGRRVTLVHRDLAPRPDRT